MEERSSELPEVAVLSVLIVVPEPPRSPRMDERSSEVPLFEFGRMFSRSSRNARSSQVALPVVLSMFAMPLYSDASPLMRLPMLRF